MKIWLNDSAKKFLFSEMFDKLNHTWTEFHLVIESVMKFTKTYKTSMMTWQNVIHWEIKVSPILFWGFVNKINILLSDEFYLV